MNQKYLEPLAVVQEPKALRKVVVFTRGER